MPKLFAQKDERKRLDFSGLDERGDLEDFIKRAKASRQGDEGIGVLHQHQLPDKEMAERDPSVEVLVGVLFLRQLDVAADRVTANVFRTAVRPFHDAWAAAGHDCEPGLRQAGANITSKSVVGMILMKPRRSEHGHTWADEMK